VIPPGSTLGVLGGGQLGRMFASEATRMGYRVTVVDPDPEAPAAQVATGNISRPWTDPEVIDELSHHTAAVTTEFENVPADVLRALAAHVPVRPSASAVAVAQDRHTEKQFLNEAGVSTAPWVAVPDLSAVSEAWRVIAAPALLKTARLGYDGKGQLLVTSEAELRSGFEELGGVPCVLERRVALAVELSVMVARGSSGEVTTWPVAENVHRDGILHSSVVPARVAETVSEAARRISIQVAVALDYVGVMGVECFVTEDGEILVNEIAPRPHNSGHWTLDAAVTSQFEQQVRTLTDLPLGDTGQLSPVAMINILGDLWRDGEPAWDAALAVPGCRLHLYGKQHPRPGRKMGHLTVMADSTDRALAEATRAWQALQPA
jgi:5-(carboxyamino)imidazole ribonucleotide synthase